MMEELAQFIKRWFGRKGVKSLIEELKKTLKVKVGKK